MFSLKIQISSFSSVSCPAACTSKERQSFNTELVKVFKEEYERMLSARGPEAVSKYDSFAEDRFLCLSGKEVEGRIIVHTYALNILS